MTDDELMAHALSVSVAFGTWTFSATGTSAHVGFAYKQFLDQILALTQVNADAVRHAVDSAAMVKATATAGGPAH